MSGWIKLHRRILDNEIWQDVTAFRLFTLLLLKASHKDGVKTRGIEVNRGQYLRSYSKLAEDLEYVEGRGFKKVSKSTVERKVKKLVDEGMISVSETVNGTMFTITKYDDYQGLDDKAESSNGTDEETNAGRSRDDLGTNVGQEQELKNLRIKELNISTTTTTNDEVTKLINIFNANVCPLSPIQMESLEAWFKDFNNDFEIIMEAIKISADRNKKSYGFVEYLLRDWANNNLNSIEQVKTHERNKFTPTTKPNWKGKPTREEMVPGWFNENKRTSEDQTKENGLPEGFDAKVEREKLMQELQQISKAR